jgi:ribosomal protein S18 acetylase RimI-like enzyme
VLAEIERSRAEPAEVGVFVIEVDGRPAGTMAFSVDNRRSRIAQLGGLAVHPDFRGRGIADEAARAFQRHLLLDLGFHRLQLEIYGFNDRAMRHAERIGFVREGAKRRAYRRHGAWWDGVLYGFLREDLGLPPGVDLAYEYVARHNQGVRTGDWEALAECLAEDAVLEIRRGAPPPAAAASPSNSLLLAVSGREAIVDAFRERPPDDELRILDAAGGGAAEDAAAGETVAVRYARAESPERPAGTIRLTVRGEAIVRLRVGVER